MAGKDDLDYEDMLEVTYEALEESGFRDIRVTDAEDLPEPEAVEGHIPDMQATNQKGITYLFEVCPPRSLRRDGTCRAASGLHPTRQGTGRTGRAHRPRR